MTHPGDSILELSTGLRIALNESGDPNGLPVFFFHGWGP